MILKEYLAIIDTVSGINIRYEDPDMWEDSNDVYDNNCVVDLKIKILKKALTSINNLLEENNR